MLSFLESLHFPSVIQCPLVFTGMEDMPREMTIEEICFLRIVHLLFQVARLAVRDTFNIEFHPTKLKTELNRNYKVLDDLRKKHIIERRQWELMFPISGICLL